MTLFAAFLRAVNVGGTGKLLMTELVDVCERAGFRRARTYIQSGNVVFETRLTESRAKAALEKELSKCMGKAVRALLRSGDELESIIERNPFANAEPNRVLVMLFDEAVDADVVARVSIPAREQLRASGRELYIHYPDGIGKSKLKVPGAAIGTARNLNTLRKVRDIAREVKTTRDNREV
jgi:uncharacterized protein (DUF1697 family)